MNDASSLEELDEILHDCPDQKQCCFSKAAKSTKINIKLNKSYKVIQDKFYSKIASLKNNNPNEIKSVKVFWECFYRKQMSKTTSYQSFVKGFKKTPIGKTYASRL